MANLRAIYENRFQESGEHRAIVWNVLVADFFQKFIPQDSTVLDLGAGYCEFTNAINARRKIAMDLNPSTPQMAGAGVEVIASDVTQNWPVDDESVDVVFTSNFFEHLPTKDALATCLSEAFRVIRSGGRLIAMGPNIRFCGDVYWDFIDHYLPLSDRSLAEAFRVAGFQIEKVIPRCLPFTMTGKRPSSAAVKLYLRVPLVWKIMGKQFLIVARKNQPLTPAASVQR